MIMTANNEPAADLTEKDRAFRAFVREENMWKVVFYVCTPLALYQSLNQIFKIFDSMMASHIGASSVSAVAYLSQLNLMLSALGGGLAVGASIKVSEAYGAGDFKLVKRRVSTLFALCGILGAGILLILVPFAPQFLRLARTPEEFITEGTTYFILDLFGIVLNFFNSVYIAIERARWKLPADPSSEYGRYCGKAGPYRSLCICIPQRDQYDRRCHHHFPASDVFCRHLPLKPVKETHFPSL